jgi:hypothetical protein
MDFVYYSRQGRRGIEKARRKRGALLIAQGGYYPFPRLSINVALGPSRHESLCLPIRAPLFQVFLHSKSIETIVA